MITCKRATIARTLEGQTIQLMPLDTIRVKRRCYNGYVVMCRFKEYIISESAMKNNFVIGVTKKS